MRRVFSVAASALAAWGLWTVGCTPSSEGEARDLFNGEESGGAAGDPSGSAGEGSAADGSGAGSFIGGGGSGATGAGGTGTTGDPDAGAGAGSGASASGGAGGKVTFNYVPPPPPDDPNCATTTLAAGEVEVVTEVQVPVEVPVEVQVERIVETIVNEPAAIYLMLDKSGSMNDTICLVPGGFLQGCQQSSPSKWQQAVSAITTFVNDPSSAGLSVGLEYFSLSNHACDGTGYDVPAVAMGDLPGNASAITTSLNATSPGGGTPTEGALNGIRRFCQQYKTANPGIQCVGVLITDGEPADCNQDAATLAGIANTTYSVDGNKVFTVGMDGANFGFLNDVAIKGGTDCTPGAAGAEACNATNSAAFLAALQGIVGQIVTQTTVTETIIETQTVYETQYQTETQTETIPCEYTIPASDAGALDFSAVEVKFTSGTSSQYIPPAGDPSNCGDGWYYDDVNDPTRILFCDSTCTVLSGLPDSSVDIEFRCLGS